MITKPAPHRTPQLPPTEIEFRLLRGQELALAKDPEQRGRLVATYRLGSGDKSDYMNAAQFFWMSGNFPQYLVTKLPWSVLLELSRPTKDEETRTKLAWLCMLWADASSRKEVPPIYAFPTEKPLVVALLDHFDNYLIDLRIIFAQAKQAGVINLPLEVGEETFLNDPLPDIVTRIRQEKSIVISRSVEAAIIQIRSVANNGLVKAELNHVDQTNNQVKAALEQVQEYLQSLKESDDSIIITSLKKHAESLERRLHEALAVNAELLTRAEAAEAERNNLQLQVRTLEAENEAYASKLSTALTGLDMVYEQLRQEASVVEASSEVQPV